MGSAALGLFRIVLNRRALHNPVLVRSVFGTVSIQSGADKHRQLNATKQS